MKATPDMTAMFRRRTAALLCAAPPVIVTFDIEFSRNVPAFVAFAQVNPGLAILLQLGFEHETAEQAVKLADDVRRALSAAPGARIVILCNCARECVSLAACGMDARLVNQNAFLDERRYRPMGRARPFAAAYIARVTPFKRHGLIPPGRARDVMLMGTYAHKAEREYAESIRRQYAAARWIPSFRGADVSLFLAQARCGLALSAAEGACFASSEYLLCGLPVVDTPARGGRDVLYPEEFVFRAEATCDAVGAGFDHWTANRPDPRAVRAAWLEKVRPHRAAFRDLMRELTGRAPVRLPHKLGVRTPHPGRLASLAIATRLAWKGLWVR